MTSESSDPHSIRTGVAGGRRARGRRSRVCVVDVSWIAAYHCAPNPCGGDVTCSCAQSLCDPGFVCVGAANAQVPCECQGC